MKRSALLRGGPQRITRGIKRPDDQAGAETNCKVIFETRDSVSNRVVDTAHMKNPKIDVMIEDNVHCGDEELIIWSARVEGVENVDSVGVVRIDHKTMRGFDER